MFLIVYLYKKAAGWSWSNFGLARPINWWRPLLVFVGCFIAIILLAVYVQPLFQTLSGPPDISHLMVLRQNFPLLVMALITIWITAAFLEELVFRAYLINTLDLLLGRNSWSTWTAIFISSVIFGMMHAWQGLSGILTTACIGFILGIGFIFNGRRIWPLVLAHGIIDTITLVTIYNM
jgi:membrane protease YdiL (CAAX protease family)